MMTRAAVDKELSLSYSCVPDIFVINIVYRYWLSVGAQPTERVAKLLGMV